MAKSALGGSPEHLLSKCFRGMQGIDKRSRYINACRVGKFSRKSKFKCLIAKLASKVKAGVSPYFGMKDFAFAPAFA